MRRNTTIKVLLTIVTVILVAYFLQATRPVSLPLAFAVVLALIFVPVYRLLSRLLPGWISAIIVLLINALLLVSLGAALAYAGAQITERLPELVDQARQIIRRIPFVSLTGLTPSQGGGGGSGGTFPTLSQIQTGLAQVAIPLSLTSLALALLVLMLLESDDFSPKVRRMFDAPDSEKILDAVRRLTPKYGRYVVVQVSMALVTGLLTWGYTLVLGVQLAFVWGLSTFLLNLLPTVGSVLAILPPTLFAFAFQDTTTGLLVLGGLSLIEFIVGNFVEPKVQGRTLRISAVVVLLSVVIWGWIWGVGGAVIGVPLTVMLIMFFREYEPTRPLAIMLSDIDTEEEKSKEKAQQRPRPRGRAEPAVRS